MEEKLKEYPKLWINQLIIAVIIIALTLWSSSAIQLDSANGDGLNVAKSIINGLMNPDLDFLFDLSNSGVAYLLLETMAIAFLGTLVGGFIAIPFSFLSATNIVPKPIAFIGRGCIMIIRTVPVFIYGIIFVRVASPGPFAGLLTMAFASIGMVSKMYIESIEDLDTKILESLDACGHTTIQKIRYGILPQLLPDFLSTIIYRFDMNLRDATVLGLVGAGGIGAPLIFAMNAYRWNEVSSILIGLVVLVLIIESISSKIRTKLARG